MEDYVDRAFRHRVEEALVAVGRVLDDESRKPRLAGNPSDEEEDQHTYDDKFGLAEFLTKMAVSAVGNVLERMGLDGEKLQSLIRVATVENRPVTLRFEAQETCEFIGEHSFKVKNPHTYVSTETTEESGATTKTKTKILESMTTVKEYRWKVGMRYSLSAFTGTGAGDRGIIGSRDGSCEVVTNTKESPLPANKVHPPLDVSLTWFLRCVDPTSRRIVFRIDRDSEQCRTPRRNREIREAAEFFNAFGTLWAQRVYAAFEQLDSQVHRWRNQQADRGSRSSVAPSASAARISEVRSASLFVPVLPLFEHAKKEGIRESSSDTTEASTQTTALPSTPTASPFGSMVITSPAAVSAGSSTPSPLLQHTDINKLLTEQCRTIDLATSQITVSFPPRNSTTEIVTTAEAQLALLMNHAASVCSHYLQGIDHIEKMLLGQLVAAVGKYLKEEDFEEFARFHYTRKLFREEYVPRAFCHAIRRPGHFPDGILSIETNSDAPIQTIMRSFELDEDRFMRVPINAATEVKIGGQCHLHAWMLHRFGGRHGTERRGHQLVARARQFSCFMLLLGKISGPDSFDPEDAIIVQNKDEIFIPLLLEELPTPKEFRDAVASLSPEQRRFAEAFREMQLESSVFGLCVVQLKPQLEVLLGLEPKSLTKEVKLTQDLLQLFIEYQIPSDLLSFDGSFALGTDGNTTEGAVVVASPVDKLNAVKGHVKSVQEMIQDKKDEELSEAEQRADMRHETATAYRTAGVYGAAPTERAYRTAGVHGAVAFGGPSPFGAPSPPAGNCFGASDVAALRAMSAAAQPTAAQTVSPPAQPKAPGVHFNAFKEATQNQIHDASKTSDVSSPGTIDFTTIPKQLDAKMASVDIDSALRTTIVKADSRWTKKSPQNLLSPELQTSSLDDDKRRSERNRAFDLLDALSRSGSLPIRCAEMHVIVAATHTFDKSVVDTVIEDNVNPIDKVERSALLMATTIHGMSSPSPLLKAESDVRRITEHSPTLFSTDDLDL